MVINNDSDMSFYDFGSFEDAFVKIRKTRSVNDILEVYLVFHNAHIRIKVHGDDDTMIIDIAESFRREKGVSRTSMFDQARNYCLAWAWELTNQQGYDDGWQVEFVNQQDRSLSIAYQFMAIGSTIEVSMLNRLDCDSES